MTPNTRPTVPTYALAAPIQIGAASATTRALDLSSVIFDWPAALEPGEAIEFSILILANGLPIEMDCRGSVTWCTPLENGDFDIAATIDSFEISRQPPSEERLRAVAAVHE